MAPPPKPTHHLHPMNSELKYSENPLSPFLSLPLSLEFTELEKLSASPTCFSASISFPPSLQIFDFLGGIIESMNRWAFEQTSMASCEEMRLESVVCPKPRRLVFQSSPDNDPIRSFRWPLNNQAWTGNSKAGAELLDIILTKESYGEKFSNQVAISPPFFGGSPPSRASNPVVQDKQFGNENVVKFCEGPPSPSSSSTRKGGRVRMKFGHGPAVRIEGFDCLNRDGRNCSISAVA